MLMSGQRLGDDPRDFDGEFQGVDAEHADVSGVRPDAGPVQQHPPDNSYEPWKIYPRPPPPHWHWKDKEQVISSDGRHTIKDDFRFEDVSVPGSHPWSFRIDDKGVFQVYDTDQGSSIFTKEV